MQQTEKYQLNLIEMSDTFSPAALNENAQKLEAALVDGLAAEAAARAEADDALDARVTALEIHRIAVGHYRGAKQTIELGFTPVMVLVVTATATTKTQAMAVAGYPSKTSTVTDLAIVENGFSILGGSISNENNGYNYIALA